MESLIFWLKFFGIFIGGSFLLYLLISAYVDGLPFLQSKETREYNKSLKETKIRWENRLEENKNKKEEKRKEFAKNLRTYREEIIDGVTNCYFVNKKIILYPKGKKEIFKDGKLVITIIPDKHPNKFFDKNENLANKYEILNYYRSYYVEPWGQNKDNSILRQKKTLRVSGRFLETYEYSIENNYCFLKTFKIDSYMINNYYKINLFSGEFEGQNYIDGEKK